MGNVGKPGSARWPAIDGRRHGGIIPPRSGWDDDHLHRPTPSIEANFLTEILDIGPFDIPGAGHILQIAWPKFGRAMRLLVWIILLLSAISVSAVRADECDAVAAEIASRIGLDAGGRTADNTIPLSARTDEEDDYGAFLHCKGPLGLTLRYLSPPSPGPKWYDFVARAGTILTGVTPASIALEAENCVENARLRDAAFRSPGPALRIVCSISKSDSRADVSLARRLPH